MSNPRPFFSIHDRARALVREAGERGFRLDLSDAYSRLAQHGARARKNLKAAHETAISTARKPYTD